MNITDNLASTCSQSIPLREVRDEIRTHAARRGKTMGQSSSETIRNLILRRLSSTDLHLLAPHFSVVDLPLRKHLEAAHKRIDHVYFFETGFASVVASGAEGSIEVGLIGREGVTGLAVIMGTDRSPHEIVVHGAGTGRRISAAALRRAMEQSQTLRSTLLRSAHVFVTQMAHTAVANVHSKIEQRLARWLCMARDRTDADKLTVTHEVLALTIGVQRPSVTVALDMLERFGFIRTGRGAILFLDRKGLEKSAAGVYGAPEAEFQRLFG
jgi:CRP-like cAMP-binding protein